MTSTFTRRALSITGATALALIATLAPQAAYADTSEPSPTETVDAAKPMTVVGYDEEVAAANGYQIITHADGSQESVPVTDEAKALEAQKIDPLSTAKVQSLTAGMSAKALVYDEVVGDCGLSYIGAEKQANDQVVYETGWVVNNAVDAWTWEVVASGFISGGSDPFTGGAHGPEWDASGSITAIGPGTAFVPGFSGDAAVILVDGGICYSSGPGVDFG